MSTTPNYYLAGGTLWFKRTGATAYAQIGQAQKIAYNAKIDYADVMDTSGAVPILGMRAPKKYTGTLKFEAFEWSEANLAMFLNAVQNVETVTDTEAGWSAKNSITLDVGKDLIIAGAFKFISQNAVGKQIILEIFNANVTTTGDMTLLSDTFNPLQFQGEVLKDSSGSYAKMHIAQAA